MRLQQQHASDTDLRHLPPMVSLDQANSALSISRNHGYRLAKNGQYPVPVRRLGNAYRVSRADLLRFLGIDTGSDLSRGDAA